MSIAGNMLDVGFKTNLKIHGEAYTYKNQSLRGMTYRVEPDILDSHIQNSSPQTKIQIWFAEGSCTKTNPFSVNEYLTKNGMTYKIRDVKFIPEEPAHWELECDGIYNRA